MLADVGYEHIVTKRLVAKPDNKTTQNNVGSVLILNNCKIYYTSFLQEIMNVKSTLKDRTHRPYGAAARKTLDTQHSSPPKILR